MRSIPLQPAEGESVSGIMLVCFSFTPLLALVSPEPFFLSWLYVAVPAGIWVLTGFEIAPAHRSACYSGTIYGRHQYAVDGPGRITIAALASCVAPRRLSRTDAWL